MKKIILIVLIAMTNMNVQAQHRNMQATKGSNQHKRSHYDDEASTSRHNLYADVGLCFSRTNVGLSLTYNYKILPWLGAGLGVQDYDFYPTVTHDHQYIPAVYADLHFIIRAKKKGQILVFLDIGKDFYDSSSQYVRRGDDIYYVPLNNGLYNGLGLGYFRSITKKGWGVYTTLKLIGNIYQPNKYNIRTGEKYISRYDEGTFVFSLGFRF
jgi:hypothetical protein